MNFASEINLRIRIIFRMATREAVDVGFAVDYHDEIRNFSDAILIMFKSSLPVEKIGEVFLSSNDRLNKLVFKHLGRKHTKRRSAYFVQLDFDFAGRTINMRTMQERATAGWGDETAVADNNFLSEVFSDEKSPFLKDLQKIKSDLVFVRRQCEAVSRKRQKIKSSGEDILSL